jgi:hypothetical protein
MLDAVEYTQIRLDYKTQSLESTTGITIVHMHEVEPLDQEELTFNKSLLDMEEFAMFIEGGSAKLRANTTAMSDHIAIYQQICIRKPSWCSGIPWSRLTLRRLPNVTMSLCKALPLLP